MEQKKSNKIIRIAVVGHNLGAALWLEQALAVSAKMPYQYEWLWVPTKTDLQARSSQGVRVLLPRGSESLGAAGVAESLNVRELHFVSPEIRRCSYVQFVNLAQGKSNQALYAKGLSLGAWGKRSPYFFDKKTGAPDPFWSEKSNAVFDESKKLDRVVLVHLQKAIEFYKKLFAEKGVKFIDDDASVLSLQKSFRQPWKLIFNSPFQPVSVDRIVWTSRLDPLHFEGPKNKYYWPQSDFHQRMAMWVPKKRYETTSFSRVEFHAEGQFYEEKWVQVYRFSNALLFIKSHDHQSALWDHYQPQAQWIQKFEDLCLEDNATACLEHLEKHLYVYKPSWNFEVSEKMMLRWFKART